MLKKGSSCLLAALILAQGAGSAEAALLVSNRPTAASAETTQARAEAALKAQAEAKAAVAKVGKAPVREVKAAETKAAEVKAAEVKAAETKAAEVKAAETKAAEVKAAEVKAAEAKAAEARASVTRMPVAKTAAAGTEAAKAAAGKKPVAPKFSKQEVNPEKTNTAVNAEPVKTALKAEASKPAVKSAVAEEQELRYRAKENTAKKESLARKAANYKSVYTVGDYGWKIRETKKKLQALGYEMKDTDANFTKDLQKQLKKYQKTKQLKSDGKLTQETYDALNGDLFKQKGINNITGYEICRVASKYKGVPYVFGGTTPRGFDCSGYVQYVFRQKGAALTRTADTQALEGVAVSQKKLKPGDLVFFTTYEPGASHVGIYAGNNLFWNATSSRGVMLSDLRDSYWGSRYYGARRVLVKNDAEK